MPPKDETSSGRLPVPGQRWVPSRKAAVIAALREGETTVEEVCRLYSLSREELLSWISAIERHGVPGLRSTRVQLYRELVKPAGRISRQSAQPPDQVPPVQTDALEPHFLVCANTISTFLR
jgi:transposase-like protein